MNKIKNINKKYLIIIGSILLVVIIVLILLFGFKDEENKLISSYSTDGERFASEYNQLNNQITEDNKEYPKVNIPNENIIKYTKISDIINIFETKGDAVIYFGYASCLYCRSAVPILLDAAKEKELEEIYYLDVSEQNGDYNKLYQILGKELLTNDIIEAPLVVFIVNGKLISYHQGTVYSHKNPYNIMNTDMVIGLSDIYKPGIQEVLNSIEYKKLLKEYGIELE